MRAVLTYHSIDGSQSPISIRPDAFAAHVRFLARGRVRVLSLAGLVAEVRAGGDEQDDAVAITFDDGFQNFAEHAAPLLAEHGLSATVFIVSGHAGRTSAWAGQDHPGIPTFPLMDWGTLGRLANDGIELGAHTRRHSALDTLSATALAEEIGGCVGEMESHLGRRPTAFAYPYGIAPAAAVEQARASFALGVTTELRALDAADDPLRIPRLDAYYLRQPDGLVGWGTTRFRAYLRFRAAVRIAREHVRRGIRFGAA